MGAGRARDAAGSRGGWMGQGRLTILQGISASQRVRISHVQGEGGAPADRAPQSRWSRDGCQRALMQARTPRVVRPRLLW